MENQLPILLFLGGLVGLACAVSGAILLLKRLGGETEVEINFFGKIKTAQNGSVALFFGVFVFWFSVSSYLHVRQSDDVLSKAVGFLSRHLSISLTDDPSFADFVSLLPQAEQDVLVKAEAARLRDEYTRAIAVRGPWTEKDFRRARHMIVFIKSLDSDNGNALYFEGQVNRAETKNQTATQALAGSTFDPWKKYLENSKTKLTDESRQPKNGTECYRRADGYCREREGWIEYTLANVYYQASQERGSHSKGILHVSWLEDADKYLTASEASYGDFEEYVPSGALSQLIRRELLPKSGGSH